MDAEGPQVTLGTFHKRVANPFLVLDHHGQIQGNPLSETLCLQCLFEKNRWLLVEFIPLDQSKPTQSRLESKQIWAALRDSIQENFGDVGWGCVSHSLTGGCIPLTVSTLLILFSEILLSHH